VIVFDASTLILIAKIDLLDTLLRGIEMRAAIPRAVENECCGPRKSFDSLVIRRVLDESRIEAIAVRDRKLVAKIRDDFNLGLGESEAISLAYREKAALIGIDDQSGINACKFLGVPFTTALGFLVRSYEKGLIDQQDALLRLADLGKHGWYRNSFIEDAKRRLELKR
jgi:predicted nucleic acid-binding protein